MLVTSGKYLLLLETALLILIPVTVLQICGPNYDERDSSEEELLEISNIMSSLRLMALKERDLVIFLLMGSNNSAHGMEYQCTLPRHEFFYVFSNMSIVKFLLNVCNYQELFVHRIKMSLNPQINIYTYWYYKFINLKSLT